MNDELWRVQFGTGEIRTMTLDALDRAFDEGVIDARVPVLAPGSHTWVTLGEAAGLEVDVVDQSPSLSPIAMPNVDSLDSLPPYSEPDLGFDPDSTNGFAVARPSRGFLVGVIPGLLAVAAALVVVVAKLGGTPPADVKVTTAIQAPLAAEALPPAATAMANAPPVAPEPVDSPAKPSLSEWQKQLLTASDKAREEKTRAKAQEKSEAAPKRKPATKVSPGFLNGGDRFDPLNGAL